MPTQFTGPVGRIVWGNPARAQDKTDQRTNQKILKDGQPIKVWSFGVAYPKADFMAGIWPHFSAEVQTGFPSGVPNGFAWKYKDGDTEVDRQGKPLREREGYAGCYIVSYSTEAFAPPIYKFNPQTGGYDQLTPDQIKTGDYVAVSHNLKVNVETDRQKNSSLFVNPAAVELVGYGKEIISAAAVDPRQAFGGQQRALPPGASAAPVLSSGGVGMPGTAPMPQPGMMPGQPAPMAPQPPQMPGYPAPAPAAPPMPAPVPVTSGYPQPAPPPMPGFAQGNGYPAPGQPAPPPPAPMAAPATVRPVDPNHIANPGTPHEQWWNGTAWVPAPQPMPGQMPGMMPPR